MCSQYNCSTNDDRPCPHFRGSPPHRHKNNCPYFISDRYTPCNLYSTWTSVRQFQTRSHTHTHLRRAPWQNNCVHPAHDRQNSIATCRHPVRLQPGNREWSFDKRFLKSHSELPVTETTGRFTSYSCERATMFHLHPKLKWNTLPGRYVVYIPTRLVLFACGNLREVRSSYRTIIDISFLIRE